MSVLLFCFVYQINVKEEDRLSAVVAEIDSDVRIVPRASFTQTPTGQVLQNRSFEGKIITKITNFLLSSPI